MISLEKRGRKETSEFDYQMKDMRQQLNEQLRCLDARLETHLALVLELQEFYKRRAEVEMEYSKNLDRLVKQIMLRHKAEKQRREFWPGFSTYTCWQTLLASTKRASKDHAILSELYNNQMCNRFTELMDDMQRMYRDCREIGFVCHEELLKVLNELQSAMKTYHVYHGESKQAENKLRYAESQKAKVEQHASKGTLSRKFKAVEKQTEKRQQKYSENKLKALKARNEYILCLDAANSALNKYFVDDIHDLIDCMDCGYHNSLARAMMMHISGEENLLKSRKGCMDLMNKCISELDQRSDKQRFLELYNLAFSHPKKFEFQAHKGDEVCQLSAQKSVQDELLDRNDQLNKRVTSIRLENDEVWKTLETAEKSLMTMINQKDYDVTTLFQEENRPPKSPHEHAKKRADRLETESFYLLKFKEYLLQNNLITRLQSKQTCIQKALGDGGVSTGQSRPPSLPPKPKKRRIARAPLVGQPKLFGGSIEEYVEATGQDIPLIVRSCIRVINLYGMHHQGVFRVSGSQHEISDFKSAFERGEDPLVDIVDGRDINSVAGVLKLYFRELREALFPIQMFDELIACCKLDSHGMSERLKELLSSLPRSIIVIMRYLFAFLSHLSEYSDENMMDPYNLAICFGPTLLPIPPDRDQVVFQNHVNDLIKCIITHQEDIFPRDELSNATMYEKCIVEEGERDECGEGNSDDEDGADGASEEEPDVMEAVALYDFQGRTDRELSFKKGETLVVFSQVSNDWWEGAYHGQDGLIPDKYISLKCRDDERKSGSGDEDKRRSTESLPAKPFGTTSLSVEETLDKSASHPNISMVANTPPAAPSTTELPSQSSYPSTSSGVSSQTMLSSTGSTGSTPSLASRLTIEDSLSVAPDLPASSTEDLQLDIDSALAEVMSGIESLQMQQKGGAHVQVVPRVHPKALASQHPKHTPDLVLDLPISTEPSSPRVVEPEPDSPTLTTAEVFAKSNQCTMKKASSMPRSTASTFGKLIPATMVRRSNSTNATMTDRENVTIKVGEDAQSKPPAPSPILERKSDLTPPPDPKPPVPAPIVVERRPNVPMLTRRHTPSPVPAERRTPERPEVPDKPKPPLRAKPQVMKKPARSPEVLKRFQKGGDSGGSSSGSS